MRIRLYSIAILRLINNRLLLLPAIFTDGIKAMSCGISGDKQVTIFSSARNRGRVCLFLTTENERL